MSDTPEVDPVDPPEPTQLPAEGLNVDLDPDRDPDLDPDRDPNLDPDLGRPADDDDPQVDNTLPTPPT